MSTSTLPISEVLCWGDAWWLPGHADPLPFTDSSHAAAVLAAAWPEERRRLRILYEPDGFRTESVECPRANRATVAWALSDRFPELADLKYGWSHEPMRACSEGFRTLLHLETKPGLMDLVDALTQAGMTVAEVWPVPTWLQMLPDNLSDSGGFAAAIVGPDRACLYHESADGSRAVKRWQGVDAMAHCKDWIHERISCRPADPGWLVSNTPGLVESFKPTGCERTGSALNVTTLADALNRETLFPARHPAQMLPPRPYFMGGALMAAASWLLLLTAVGWAGMTGWSWHRAHQVTSRDLPAFIALRHEVAQLDTNAAEIARLQAMVDPGDTVRASDMLALLSSDLPEEIVLDRFDAQTTGLLVQGWTIPGSSLLETWFEGLKVTRPNWNWLLTRFDKGAFEIQVNSA